MNKQALTEALDYIDTTSDHQYVMAPKDGPVVTAARLVERLLPGECGSCNGVGLIPGQLVGSPDRWIPCEPCHSNGQVWDEGIVEVVAKALHDHSCNDDGREHRDEARAVLSALVELLTEKVER